MAGSVIYREVRLVKCSLVLSTCLICCMVVDVGCVTFVVRVGGSVVL